MALGKGIGTVEYKMVTTTYLPGPGGTVTVQGNCEGIISGQMSGAAQGTLTVENAGEQGGVWRMIWAVFPADGNPILGTAQGTWETTGTYQWRLKGLSSNPDGQSVAVEGVGEMANRSLTFTGYEWS